MRTFVTTQRSRDTRSQIKKQKQKKRKERWEHPEEDEIQKHMVAPGLLLSEWSHLDYGDGGGGDNPAAETAGVETQLQQQQQPLNGHRSAAQRAPVWEDVQVSRC